MRISISLLFIFALLSVGHSLEEPDAGDNQNSRKDSAVLTRFKRPTVHTKKPYNYPETTTAYYETETTTYETQRNKVYKSKPVYKKPVTSSYYKQTTTTASYDEQDTAEYTTTYTAPVARKKIHKTKPSYKKPSVPYYKSTSTSDSYDEPETTTSYQETSRQKIYKKPHHHSKYKSAQPQKPKNVIRPRYPPAEEDSETESSSRYENELQKSCAQLQSIKCNLLTTKLIDQAEEKINQAVGSFQSKSILNNGKLNKLLNSQSDKLTQEYSRLINDLKTKALKKQNAIHKKLSLNKIGDGLVKIATNKLGSLIKKLNKEVERREFSFLHKLKLEESNIFYNVSELMRDFDDFISHQIKEEEKARKKTEVYGIKKVGDKLTTMFNKFVAQSKTKCGCSGKQTPYTSSPVSSYNTYEVSNDQENYTPVKPAKKHVKKHKAPIKKKKHYKPKTTKVANYPADDNSYDDKQPSYENNNNKKYTPVKKNVKKYKTTVKKAPIKKKKQFKPELTKIEPYPAEKQEYDESYYGKHIANKKHNKPVRKHNKKYGPRKNAKGYKTSSTTSEDSYDPVRGDDYLKSFYSKHTQKHHLNKKHIPTNKHSYKAPTVEPAAEENYNHNYHSKHTSLKKPNNVEKIDRSYEQDVDLE